jgi:DNA-binding CsgD family transcriptional regulator
MTGDIRSPFVGREAELAALGRAFDDARSGRPRLAAVEGPAGIGKTALVERFLDVAAGDCVLRASGAEAESGLPLGVLQQLAGGRDVRALGVDPIPIGPTADPLVAGAALVDWVGELQQGHQVVLIAVDDAQWADHPSLAALTFALRRLRVDRVLTILTSREIVDPHVPEGLRRLLFREDCVRLALAGLNDDEVRRLGTALGVGALSTKAAARLRAHTEGNPLHICALLQQLPARTVHDLDAPLPAPRSFTLVVVARWASCERDVQELVGAASVLGVRCLLHMAAELAEIEDALPVLEAAISAGLLLEEPDRLHVRFTHPLVRAAIYEQLGPRRRSRLHSQAAGVTSDEELRLHHRARAAIGPDTKVSADLAAMGQRRAAEGAWTLAAGHLAEAARLASTRADYEQLSLEAAECLMLAGQLSQAAALAAELRTFPPSAWRSYVLGSLAFFSGGLDEAEMLLEDAWRRCEPDSNPEIAARLAAQLSGLSVLHGRGRDAARWGDLAVRFRPDPTTVELLHFRRLIGLGMIGQAEEGLASLPDLPTPASASIVELDQLLGRGLLRLWTDDLTGAYRDIAGVLAAAADRAVMFRVVASGLLAQAEYRLGHWDDAITHCHLSISLSEDAEQPWLAPQVHSFAALVHAARGNWTEADSHLLAASPGVLGVVVEATLVHAANAAAHVSAARSDPEGVLAAIEPLFKLDSAEAAHEPGVLAWQDLLVEALVAQGRFEDAQQALERFERLAEDRRRYSAMAALARARGTLDAARGDTASAVADFETGIEYLGTVYIPFDRARLELAYGACLRRTGSRRRAATHLKSAHAILEQLGARPYLERCERELGACGLSIVGRSEPLATRLTPQELAVARLAANGLTNRDIARQLIVSVKTVEYHLGHAYTKLEVTSRAQLGQRLQD